jgi:hypothetical protein
MRDVEFQELMTSLANAVRDLSGGLAETIVRERVRAVVDYLTEKGLLERGDWHLGPRS